MALALSLRSCFSSGLIGLCTLASLPVKAQAVPSSSQFRQYRALDSTIGRAFEALKARRFDEAKATLGPCLEAIPDHFEAHYILALVDFELRDFPGALVHLEIAEQSLAALEKNQRESLAELKARSEANAQEAKDNLSTAISRTTDPTGISATKIASLSKDVRVAEAKNGSDQKLESSFIVPADYLFLKGNTLLRLGRREEARSAYRRTVEKDATHANAWNNLIALSLVARDQASARDDLAQAGKAGVSIRPELKKAVLEAH